jgi:N-acetyl-alpha-D-muramate 1-phosphate uridylyltransferase
MQCVILAGGLGTRIKGRSGELPKALIPLLGKPFIFYQLEWLARQNVRRVVVSIGHRGEAITRAVDDGSPFGLSIAYCDEGENLRGTGGALRLAADRGLLDPGFFVLYGDSYLPVELAPLWHASEGGRVATMAVMQNKGRWDRSNVVFRDGRVVLYDKSVGGTAGNTMDYIDYGVSVLPRDVVMESIGAGEVADLSTLLNRLSMDGRLRGHEVFERFYEIGSPQGLEEFEEFLRSQSSRSVSDRA